MFLCLKISTGTGPAHVLRQASISVVNNHECGANSDNMLCAGKLFTSVSIISTFSLTCSFFL